MQAHLRRLTVAILVGLWFQMSAWAADNTTGATAFSAKVTGDIYGQVKVIDDVDGDGKKDLVFGATDGMEHLYSAKGSEIYAGLWPKHTGGPILADVAVADLDADGQKEVIVGSYDGNVYGLNSWGKELWKVNTRGTIQLSAPEVADVEGDGKLSIFVGSRAGTVSRIDAQGRLTWEVPMTTKVSAKVIASDLDGDGVKEIVCKDDSGKVSVLTKTGSVFRGWPQNTAANLDWPFEVTAADLNGDGRREVITTTPDKKLNVWTTNGALLRQLKLTDGAHSAPRLADMDGDGKAEFVFTQADGKVQVMKQDGTNLRGWPYDTKHSIYGAPQILDIDGDGRLDVVFTAWNPEGVGKQAGYILALSRDGKVLSGFPKHIGKTIAPLTFADLDDDGFLEMIAAGGINYTDNQLHVIPTQARVQIRMAVLGTEVNFE